VRREGSPEDRRGVLAAITDKGRALAKQAMVTYGQDVWTHFVGQLSRPQVGAVEEMCRHMNGALKQAERAEARSLLTAWIVRRTIRYVARP